MVQRSKPTAKQNKTEIELIKQDMLSLFGMIQHVHGALYAYDEHFKLNHDELIKDKAEREKEEAKEAKPEVKVKK